MSKQVPWNKFIVEEFVKDAMLTKDEEMVLRTRVAGWTITEQSMKLGMSTATISRMIARLKVKYDNVSKTNPLLPHRKYSVTETYMDEH